MKNSIAILGFVLLLSGAAEAQEKSLYEMSSRTLDIVEVVAACADQDGGCTRQDIEALKTAIGDNRRELVAAIQSGGLRGLIVNPEEGEALLARAEHVRGQFMHIQVFGELCNIALSVTEGALSFLQRTIGYWIVFCKYVFSSPGLYFSDLATVALVTVFIIPFLLVDIVIGLVGLPAISACLLWWL